MSVLGLPTYYCLHDFTIQTTHIPDGLLFANIMREAQVFDQRNPSASPFDGVRHCVLAFDLMSCRGSFAVNYHTNNVVGLGVDCLPYNVILNELKIMENFNKYDQQPNTNAVNNKEKPFELPKPVKHFLALPVSN